MEEAEDRLLCPGGFGELRFHPGGNGEPWGLYAEGGKFGAL